MGLRLNLGCGRSPLAGWVNVDVAPLPGIDVVADLDRCRTHPLPFAEGSASEFFLSHVLGEIPDRAGALAEYARVLRPGGTLAITEGLPDPVAHVVGTYAIPPAPVD